MAVQQRPVDQKYLFVTISPQQYFICFFFYCYGLQTFFSVFIFWNSVFFDLYGVFPLAAELWGSLCVFTRFTVDVKLTTRSILVLRRRRRSETQRLRVFWLCEDFFFFLWEF